MPDDTDWKDIVEAAYAEISPRNDPDSIAVLDVNVIDEETCIALVNPP